MIASIPLHQSTLKLFFMQLDELGLSHTYEIFHNVKGYITYF
jgi:hypothetical protein